MGKIHVRNWSGQGAIRIIDMANAGKRGKRCESIHYGGYRCGKISVNMNAGEVAAERAANEIEFSIARMAGKKPNDAINMIIDGDFAEVAGMIKAIVAAAVAAGAPSWAMNVYDESIRGVDAPVAMLVASNEKVSASADESGISLRDLVDGYNWPAMCSIRQSHQQAYKYAAKVWPKVVEAVANGANMHAVGDILSGAGCSLHYWCMMD